MTGYALDLYNPHMDVIIQMAKANLAFFAQQMLIGPKDPPFGGDFLIGDHHEEWAQMINEHQNLCVLAPRGVGKSEFFTVAYVIWEAFFNPGKEALILSGGEEQAWEQMEKIKTQIEDNPKLAHLLPRGSKKVWSKSKIVMGNGFTVRAKGFMTKLRGAHPQFIVLDDVVNEESAFSDIMRKKVWHFFTSAIFNMKHVASVKFRVVGTPQHNDDLYGKLKEASGFHFAKFQAIKPDGTALWPEVLSLEVLKEIKGTVGELVFARERQCDVVNDDASVFPISLFLQPGVQRRELRLGMPAAYWDQAGVTMRYMGVDFAISTSQGADFTVLFIIGLDQYGNRWVIDIIRDKGLGFQDQLGLIEDAHARYDLQMIYCESNQMQRIFTDELARTTALPVRKVITGSEKHSLERGLPSMRLLHEQRKYRIPRGDARSIELTDAWMKEMQAFTFDRGRVKSSASHDDIGMANYICEQAIREADFHFSFGEEEEDQAAWEELYGEEAVESGEEELLLLRAEPWNRYGKRSLGYEEEEEEQGSVGSGIHPADAARLAMLVPRR